MPAAPENKTINNASSSSLEDRHFLSDPRPVPGLDLPTWEVDVFREGVDLPIMTLKVDSTVLPPRKNKKKKVLWRLPDSIETLPKFGEQDKKRILELFREKKKELKKLKNKQRAYRRASSMEASAKQADLSNKMEGNNTKLNTGDSGSSSAKVAAEGGRSGSEPNANGDHSISASLDSLPPPPPGLPASSPLKPAPPGLPSQNRNSMNSTGGFSHSSSSMSSGTTSQRNGEISSPSQYNGQRSQLPSPPPGLTNGQVTTRLTQELPPVSVGPCFVHPPSAPPGLSIGKFVTETYYVLLRNGMIEELDAYYYSEKHGADTVSKALMVGGAYAVCASPQDRWMQLNTFAGTEMRIKGIQEQTTVGKAILVLITGVSIRTSPEQTVTNGHPTQQQQQQLPFCHTMILKPVLSETTTPTIGYQILNDNLVILTGED